LLLHALLLSEYIRGRKDDLTHLERGKGERRRALAEFESPESRFTPGKKEKKYVMRGGRGKGSADPCIHPHLHHHCLGRVERKTQEKKGRDYLQMSLSLHVRDKSPKKIG